jgi:hypothetical protein
MSRGPWPTITPTTLNTVGIDPNLRHPRVQQYSIGVQHDFKGTVFEARYVGNHVVGAYRAFDFNQVVIGPNGFLQDFRAPRRTASGAGCGEQFQPRPTPTFRVASPYPVRQIGEGSAHRSQCAVLPANR